MTFRDQWTVLPKGASLELRAGIGEQPCAPLAEVVAQQEATTMELQARVRALLAPLERAGFTGNLTLTFRKADNSRMSRIKAVEIVQM